MPLIGVETYNIDFFVLETNDAKTINLVDRSNYLSAPEKPMLFIILPGYTGHVEVPYAPLSIITINSDNLKLTEECEYEELADLPDGVYQIKMGVCPYNELHSKKAYLKTTKLDQDFQNILLSYENCECLDQTILKQSIIDIDILIQSAKAEANIYNIERATSKYKTAANKLNKLEKKINCK